MVHPVLGDVPEGASNCHGILTEDLDSAPNFGEIAYIVEGFIYNKTVVAYNADFDFALLATEFARLHHPRPQVSSVQCAMDRYSAWNGEWSAKKNDFKWQKLPNLSGRLSHDALVDCENLHLLIQKMATGKEDESNITSDEININF
jgi:DNA polymerase III epsilon subunit-like protein